MISSWLVFWNIETNKAREQKRKEPFLLVPFEGTITWLPLPNGRKAKLGVPLGWEKSYLGTGEKFSLDLKEFNCGLFGN